MEATATKCSMCQAHDMVRAPHRSGTINEGPIYMICPYCDTSSGETETDSNGKVNGIARPMPLNAVGYAGVGPHAGNP